MFLSTILKKVAHTNTERERESLQEKESANISIKELDILYLYNSISIKLIRMIMKYTRVLKIIDLQIILKNHNFN